MAPLSAVVEAALSAEGVQITHPSACKLLLGKKEMDLSTPLRFANLPTGAKLQLITGDVPELSSSCLFCNSGTPQQCRLTYNGHACKGVARVTRPVAYMFRPGAAAGYGRACISAAPAGVAH